MGKRSGKAESTPKPNEQAHLDRPAEPSEGATDGQGSLLRIECAHDSLLDPASLVPHPRNPNQHPAAQIDLLAKIMTYQGFRSPIVVSSRSGFITKGHGRLAAAIKAGFQQVPVDFQDYASEAAEYADMIADNRLSELSELDPFSASDLFKDIEDAGLDAELTGYTAQAVEDLVRCTEAEATDLPALAAGDKEPYQQKTFIVHDEQAEEIDAAIAKAKEMGHGESAVNDNSNGNALAFICQHFNRANS